MALSPELLARLLGASGSALDTSGLKLTLGDVYEYASPGFLGAAERRLPEYRRVEPTGRVYRLKPGAYLVRYSEAVRVPIGFIALAYPRSSLLRMGVILYTAVWDPGYEGRGVTLLVVHNPHGVELEKGAHIAQLVYIPVIGPSREYRGVYRGEGLR